MNAKKVSVLFVFAGLACFGVQASQENILGKFNAEDKILVEFCKRIRPNGIENLKCCLVWNKAMAELKRVYSFALEGKIKKAGETGTFPFSEIEEVMETNEKCSKYGGLENHEKSDRAIIFCKSLRCWDSGYTGNMRRTKPSLKEQINDRLKFDYYSGLRAFLKGEKEATV